MREAEVIPKISIVAPGKICDQKTVARRKRDDKMRAMPPKMAEMMDMTMVATTRRLLPLCAPPMASPPEMKKNTQVHVPPNNNP